MRILDKKKYIFQKKKERTRKILNNQPDNIISYDSFDIINGRKRTNGIDFRVYYMTTEGIMKIFEYFFKNNLYVI